MKRKKGKGQPTNGVTTLSIKPPAMRPNVMESDVGVPLAWSLLLATSLGLAATLGAVASREVLEGRWEWWVSLAVGGCVWVAVFAWRVVVCEEDRRALLLYPLEVALGQDLNQDGHVGEPEVTPEVTVEPTIEDGLRLVHVYNARREDRRRRAEDFRYFLKNAYDGRGTTWQKWDGAALPSGRQVSQTLWEMWTGRLVKAGLATRAYSTAPLALAGNYRQALMTFHEAL